MTAATADLALAHHAATLTHARIPASAIRAAKIFLLDTLAVGVAGSTVPESDHLLQIARRWSAPGQACVWGREATLDPLQAVLMNAFQVHCQEYDCLHEGAVLHAMATLLPTLLAQAEAGPTVDGKTFLTALVAGIDVASNLGLAARHGMRFFRPATSGGFGAVAGLARIRGLTPEATLAAFGHQLAQSSGTMQGHTEGSALLPLQIALNARAAWQACDLAEAGFPSLERPLTGAYGYLPLFETDHRLDELIPTLGTRWRIEEFSHKPFPSGRATHGGVEGLMTLRERHGFNAESVQSVTIHGPTLINRLVNRPLVARPTPNYARLCMPFVLAKVLQHGEIDPAHYRDAELTDPLTHALASKVRMTTDDNPDPNAFGPQTVTVTLIDGTVLTQSLDTVLASPARPLSREVAIKKVRRCWAMAQTTLPDADRMIDLVDRLESLDDVRALINGLRPA